MKFLSTFNGPFFHAVDYYASIDRVLARRFITAVDQTKSEIIKFPKIGRDVGSYRVRQLKGFPFSICYQQMPGGELVALVLHHHKQQEPFGPEPGDATLESLGEDMSKAPGYRTVEGFMKSLEE